MIKVAIIEGSAMIVPGHIHDIKADIVMLPDESHIPVSMPIIPYNPTIQTIPELGNRRGRRSRKRGKPIFLR